MKAARRQISRAHTLLAYLADLFNPPLLTSQRSPASRDALSDFDEYPTAAGRTERCSPRFTCYVSQRSATRLTSC